MNKIEILKNHMYLIDNEKGSKYLQVILYYGSGKHHSNVVWLNDDSYQSIYSSYIDW